MTTHSFQCNARTLATMPASPPHTMRRVMSVADGVLESLIVAGVARLAVLLCLAIASAETANHCAPPKKYQDVSVGKSAAAVTLHSLHNAALRPQTKPPEHPQHQQQPLHRTS